MKDTSVGLDIVAEQAMNLTVSFPIREKVLLNRRITMAK